MLTRDVVQKRDVGFVRGVDEIAQEFDVRKAHFGKLGTSSGTQRQKGTAQMLLACSDQLKLRRVYRRLFRPRTSAWLAAPPALTISKRRLRTRDSRIL